MIYMEKELAYNACDIVEVFLEKPSDILRKADYLYIGSYFCDLYLLSLPENVWDTIFDYSKKNKKKVVFVIPVVSQRNLVRVKDKIGHLFEKYGQLIREVVVNDYAMLIWINDLRRDLKIWCGRLMSKETRDPRYPEFYQTNKLHERIINGQLLGVDVIGLELDTFKNAEWLQNRECRVACHTPLSYVSMGRYCEIESIGKETKNKFRLVDACTRKCRNNWQLYENDKILFIKFGKAVYAKCWSSDSLLSRSIYNGIADLIGVQLKGKEGV